jgi:hypothetical protein
MDCKDKESAYCVPSYLNSGSQMLTENVPYDTAASIIPARRDRSSQRSVCGVSDDMIKIRADDFQARFLEDRVPKAGGRGILSSSEDN